MSDLVQRLRDPDSLLAELMARLGTDDPLFSAFRDAMPDKYWARYDLSAVRLGYEFARLETERLTAELETERMRLAACGVVAMCNTPESAAQQRQMRPEYWCASVQEVAKAVDREMALRAERALDEQRVADLMTDLDRVAKERDALRADAARYRWLRIQLGGDQEYDAELDAQIAAEDSNG